MLRVGKAFDDMDLSSYGKVNNFFFLSRVLIYLCLGAALVAAIVVAPLWLAVPAMILLGFLYAHGVELQHQALHNSAFSSKAWNRFVGVLLGLPMMVSYSDYQLQHLRHHRNLGTDEDREFFNYGYGSLTTFRRLIPHLFMVRHYRDVSLYLVQAVFGGFRREGRPHEVKKIRREYQLMVLFLLTMGTLTALFGTTLFLKVWLLPLLVAIPAHAVIELPEHIGCDLKTRDVYKNTRTIRASRLAVWFVNGNNYHVEHHWLPSIPNNRLPELHAKVREGIDHCEPSYWTFYRDFLSQLLSRKGKPEAVEV